MVNQPFKRPFLYLSVERHVADRVEQWKSVFVQA